tara:strand:- start:437 stop:901 length:465 start_codon:yes stop_codon:yes gene_type:complete
MDEKIDEAALNIIKVYLAQMNSAVKISEIICKHEKKDEITGDHIISGLVYRLMNPMTPEDMTDSLEKADNLMYESTSDEEDLEVDLEDDLEDDSEVYEKPTEWRKIKKNKCDCDICKRVRECLDKYETYDTFDPLVTRFKESIKETCTKHKIII